MARSKPDPTRVAPRPALVLGWLGVAPFAALAMASLLDGLAGDSWILRALAAYGAVILSFMGGAQWGAAMMQPSRPRAYAISVLPALIGWVGLALPAPWSLVELAAGFALLLAYDVWSTGRGLTPAWYAGYRAPLTAAVVACLAAPLYLWLRN